MSTLSQLYKLAQDKYKIQSQSLPEWTKSSVYLTEIPKELEEIQVEVKPNNVVYLEDELGDVFRDLLSLIESLKQEGLIDGLDTILEHAVQKYQQRVAACHTTDGRKQVKLSQKELLKQQHISRYGNL